MRTIASFPYGKPFSCYVIFILLQAKIDFLNFFWPEYSKVSIYFRRINRQVPLKKINFSLYSLWHSLVLHSTKMVLTLGLRVAEEVDEAEDYEAPGSKNFEI